MSSIGSGSDKRLERESLKKNNDELLILKGGYQTGFVITRLFPIIIFRPRFVRTIVYQKGFWSKILPYYIWVFLAAECLRTF